MAASDFIAKIEQAVKAYDQTKAALDADTRTKDSVKAADLREARQKLDAVVRDARVKGLRALDDAEGKLGGEEAQATARAIEPRTDDEWHLAALKALFVKEEVAGWQAGEIPKRYATALAAGDRVSAYLLQRYGRERLGEESRPKNRSAGAPFGQVNQAAAAALHELDRLDVEANPVDQAALDRIAARRKQLREQRRYLQSTVTAADKEALRAMYGY